MRSRTLTLLALLLTASLTLAQALPERPAGPVADLAGVLDDAVESRITAVARALWEQAGFALVIATVPSIGEEPIEEYANKLYEKWGIGGKDKSEGVLVLLSMSPRRVRVEVGYGAEGYLNDARAGRLLEEQGIPSFRAGRYDDGMLSLAGAIAGAVAQEKQISLRLPMGMRRPQPTAPPQRFSFLQIVFLLIAAAFLLGTPFGRTMLMWMIVSNILGGGRRSGGGFGGGFGGGGFGGGFGGGMSGGGGASRSF